LIYQYVKEGAKNEMRQNLLRAKMYSEGISVGTHIHSTWPGIIEIIGKTALVDYVEFAGEYSPYDLHWLDTLARLTELYQMSSLLKIDQSCQTFFAQRAIGSGIQGILFTDIRSVADAQACVRSVRADTPETGGLYGCGMRRDVGYLLECGSPEFVQATRELMVGLMIEKKSAVDHLEEILAVKGIDFVQFGPCDYSLSIGKPGEWKCEEVLAAEEKTIKIAQKCGIIPRVELFSYDAEVAQRYLDLGIRHFCIGYDVAIQYNWIRENFSKLRGAFE
jgi:2-keto-3-deoxy-L-rhamnonate aldolase RhmA